MIICSSCGKENQDHFNFCLGCGTELKASSPAEAENVGTMNTMVADTSQTGLRSPTPPAGMPQAAPPSLTPAPSPAALVSTPSNGARQQSSPPSVQSGGGTNAVAQRAAPTPAVTGEPPRLCTACNASVPPQFKFCGACGTKIPEEVPSPTLQTGTMTLIRPDGSEGGTHELSFGENTIGRDHGGVFANDGYLSPTHAQITIDEKECRIRDLDSLNGVFLRMTSEEVLVAGQIIRVGQELLRFDVINPSQTTEDGTEIMGSPNPGYWGKITVIVGDGVDGSAYPLLGDSVTLGRERGDINFPEDGYVSGLHARIFTRGGRVYVTDLGSSNGSFIKLSGERTLPDESHILLGQQLFRINLKK